MTAPDLRAWAPVPGIPAAWLLSYDINRFPFAQFFRDCVFDVDQLDRLHASHLCAAGPRAAYADNLRLRRLMQGLPLTSEFYSIYGRFVRELVVLYFGRRITYAARPKMRVHLSGSGSVSLWHRDADITGRPEQITIWLPLTDCAGSNSLWVEDDYGSQHYRPIRVLLGQALFFDGGLLEHGTVANDSGRSRVSFDLRFTPDSPPTTMTHRILGCRPASLRAPADPAAAG